MEILEKRLKTARTNAGLKQVDVMRKVGINNKTLSGYENGVAEPDLDTLKVLATLYNVSLDWLTAQDIDKDEPLSQFDRFIRYMEAKYGVKLQDNPIVINSFHTLVECVAQREQEQEQNFRLHAL